MSSLIHDKTLGSQVYFDITYIASSPFFWTAFTWDSVRSLFFFTFKIETLKDTSAFLPMDAGE